MFNRRHAFQALALGVAGQNAATGAGPAADVPLTIESLRGAAALAGFDLSDARLRILLPVLENRRRQLRELRAIPIEDHARPRLPAVR